MRATLLVELKATDFETSVSFDSLETYVEADVDFIACPPYVSLRNLRISEQDSEINFAPLLKPAVLTSLRDDLIFIAEKQRNGLR